MDNNKYLNEEKYQQSNAKVKKVGKILLIVGIIILVVSFIFTIIGFLGFGNTAVSGINSFNSFGSGNEINTVKNTASGAFGSIGLFAIGGFMGTVGFLLTVAGGIVMFIAHRREITAYTTQQVMPVGKEIIDEMAPTVGNAVGEIAKGIKQGLKDSDEK